MTTDKVITHLWQDQGLGVAPFHVHGVISIPSKAMCEANPNAYNLAMGDACHQAKALGVHLCSCYSCGMSLEHNYVIRDANKKFFVVGCDCAMKTFDTKIMTEVQNLERKRLKAVREAKSAAAAEARYQTRQAEMEAQRAKNGGRTDYEVACDAKTAELNAVQAANKAKYGWILNVLNQVPYDSEFVRSMAQTIENRGLEAISPKCENILCDIYAKTLTGGAKRGSKKYNAAETEFGVRMDEFRLVAQR